MYHLWPFQAGWWQLNHKISRHVLIGRVKSITQTAWHGIGKVCVCCNGDCLREPLYLSSTNGTDYHSISRSLWPSTLPFCSEALCLNRTHAKKKALYMYICCIQIILTMWFPIWAVKPLPMRQENDPCNTVHCLNGDKCHNTPLYRIVLRMRKYHWISKGSGNQMDQISLHYSDLKKLRWTLNNKQTKKLAWGSLSDSNQRLVKAAIFATVLQYSMFFLRHTNYAWSPKSSQLF